MYSIRKSNARMVNEGIGRQYVDWLRVALDQ